MKDIIINLSQRGGSHLRPLLAMLNREFPNGDFKAKSGNVCLRLSTILSWLNREIKTIKDVKKCWKGTNIHNQICVEDLIPIGMKRNESGWCLKKTSKESLLCGLVWNEDRSDVQEAMELMADFLIQKLN